MGIVKSVITQNIDLLHQKGGSRNVIEVHGSPSVHRCVSCGKSMEYEEVCRIVRTGTYPVCPACANVIKPDVVFFGEMLPEDALQKAVEESSKADLMLVLGSTLVVQPAASFPAYTVRNGGSLVIVNNMETPLDSHADLRYQDLEAVFRYIRSSDLMPRGLLSNF